jgi:hypothetical protein
MDSKAIKSFLADQIADVRRRLEERQVSEWVREEVDRYLASLSRSKLAEERLTASSKASAEKAGLGNLMTVREVAGALHVTPATVRGYVRIGALKGHKIVRRILVSRNSLLRLVNADLPTSPKGDAK